MVMEVTIKLPESLLEYAKVQADSSQRAVEDVLADTLEMLWLSWENLPNSNLSKPVTSLSDSEVLMLANAKMDSKDRTAENCHNLLDISKIESQTLTLSGSKPNF